MQEYTTSLVCLYSPESRGKLAIKLGQLLSIEIDDRAYQVVAEVEVPLFQRYSLELHPILQLVLEYLPYTINKNPPRQTSEAGDDENIVV